MKYLIVMTLATAAAANTCDPGFLIKNAVCHKQCSQTDKPPVKEQIYTCTALDDNGAQKPATDYSSVRCGQITSKEACTAKQCFTGAEADCSGQKFVDGSTPDNQKCSWIPACIPTAAEVTSAATAATVATAANTCKAHLTKKVCENTSGCRWLQPRAGVCKKPGTDAEDAKCNDVTTNLGNSGTTCETTESTGDVTKKCVWVPIGDTTKTQAHTHGKCSGGAAGDNCPELLTQESCVSKTCTGDKAGCTEERCTWKGAAGTCTTTPGTTTTAGPTTPTPSPTPAATPAATPAPTPAPSPSARRLQAAPAAGSDTPPACLSKVGETECKAQSTCTWTPVEHCGNVTNSACVETACTCSNGYTWDLATKKCVENDDSDDLALILGVSFGGVAAAALGWVAYTTYGR